jgi:hypothetical protein
MMAALAFALALMGESFTPEAIQRLSEEACAKKRPLDLAGFGACVEERKKVLGQVLPGIENAARAINPDGFDMMVWTANRDIKANGWEFKGGGAEVVLYVKMGAPTGAGNPTIWERYEYRNAMVVGDTTYRSTASLTEVDCREARSRMLSYNSFSENNLGGVPMFVSMPLVWTYGVPGSRGAGTIQLACTAPKAAK